MTLRRAFYTVLFPAAVVLPAWLLVGSAIFGGGGWQTLGVLLGSIVLFLVMGAISGVIYFRPGVRSSRSVSWIDVGFLTVLYASIVALGFPTPQTGKILAVVIIAISGGFLWSLWKFFTEARKRVQDVFASFEVPPTAPMAGPRANRVPAGIRNDGEYIVIETSRDTH